MVIASLLSSGTSTTSLVDQVQILILDLSQVTVGRVRLPLTPDPARNRH